MAPATVVGEEFMVPSLVGLEILRKNRVYDVKDSNGNNIFVVKRDVVSMHEHYQLLDVAGRTLMTLRKKVLTMHDRWQVFRGESTDENDMMFTVKKSSAIQLKTKLHVYLGKNIDEDVWDFCLKCNWSRDSCVISAGDKAAQMISDSETFSDIWTTKDHFDVTVYPNIDYAFIVALIVILDATQMIYRTRAKNANTLRKFIGFTHPIEDILAKKNIGEVGSAVKSFIFKIYQEYSE